MPTRAAAAAEVGDESVTQMLGGRDRSGCGCYETSSDRGNIVSLIMNGLHQMQVIKSCEPSGRAASK